MTGERHSFRVTISLLPPREGFAGSYADVAVAPEGVTIKGEERGFFHLPLARIARMRLGFNESRSGITYEVKIWIEGEREPMALQPLRESLAPYAAAMRVLAAALAQDGKLARVHTGVSKFGALIGPVLAGIALAGALFVAGFAMHPPKWWHFVVIPGLPAVAFGLLTWQAAARLWPRPVRSLAELYAQLPR